jgi:hypothetical protein
MNYIGYFLAGCVIGLPITILESYFKNKFLQWYKPPCINNTRSFLITFTTDIRDLDNFVNRFFISRQVSVVLPFHLSNVKQSIQEALKKEDETIKELDSFAINYMYKLPNK